MILLILLPFALLLGMSGEKGTQITLLYIKGLLGAAATKIIYGFYMSFILLFAVALNKAAADQFALGGFLISIIFVFAIKFRKTFLKASWESFRLILGATMPAMQKNWIKRTAGHFVTAYIAANAAHARASNPNPQTRRGTGNPNPPNRQEGRSQAPGGQQNRNQTSGQGSAPLLLLETRNPVSIRHLVVILQDGMLHLKILILAQHKTPQLILSRNQVFINHLVAILQDGILLIKKLIPLRLQHKILQLHLLRQAARIRPPCKIMLQVHGRTAFIQPIV